VAEIGDANLVLVVREDPGNDQVVGTGDEGDEADPRRVGARCLQSGEEGRVGSQLGADA